MGDASRVAQHHPLTARESADHCQQVSTPWPPLAHDRAMDCRPPRQALGPAPRIHFINEMSWICAHGLAAVLSALVLDRIQGLDLVSKTIA